MRTFLSTVIFLSILFDLVQAERLYFSSRYEFSQNQRFILIIEGFGFEGLAGDQRIMVKEDGVVLFDTLLGISTTAISVSNEGELAIPYSNRIEFYDKNFNNIGTYWTPDSLVFLVEEGSPYWGIYAEDGNVFYCLSYSKAKEVVILVLTRDGSEVNSTELTGYAPYQFGMFNNMLILMCNRKGIGSRKKRIMAIDNMGRIPINYEIQPFLRHDPAYLAIDKKNGWLLFHKAVGDSIIALDITKGEYSTKIGLADAERYLYHSSFPVIDLVLTVFEWNNHAISSEDHLFRIRSLYNELSYYPHSSNFLVNRIREKCSYLIRLSEFKKEYPNAFWPSGY